MSFTSFNFIIFLCATLLVYYIVPQKYRYIVVACSGTVFYFLLSKWLIVLLLAVAILSYTGAFWAKKKSIFIFVIVAFVAILAFYKYAGLLVDMKQELLTAFNFELPERLVNLVLPVGISFYIFEAISYVADCRKGLIKPEKNFLLVYTFLSFFATVVSGPIERAGNMIPQLRKPHKVSYDDFIDALMLIMWGFFLKLVLANRLSIFVNSVYDNPSGYPGTIVFLGTIFYTFEIYCDFAGYSSIARGVASLMGIKICANFDSPYLSENIAEFWRRWHMSLSNWLRDYIYIPLGGNRKGVYRKLLNLMIVFLISGIWHGATMTFVVWGLLHGLYQVTAILLKPIRNEIGKIMKTERHISTYRAIRVIVTFLLVNFAWIFFRADTFANAFEVIKQSTQITPWVFTDNSLFGLGLSQPDIRVLFISLAILAITDICNKRGIAVRKAILAEPLVIRWISCIAAILFIAICGVWGPGYNAGNFIYMGF